MSINEFLERLEETLGDKYQEKSIKQICSDANF